MLKISRRGIQICLGLLWLLDGALQLQHQMFSSAFATQVINPATLGQPKFVSGPMNFGVHLLLLHPAIFNALFALTQLAIGVLILWKPTVKLGLVGSVIWGLVVWVFGEGYGGIFSLHTLLLMGAPGAVIIYAILALAVMPTNHDKDKNHKKQPAAYWLVFVWLILWVGGGVYQMLPGQNSTSDVSGMIAGNVEGAPNWLASVDTHTANAIGDLGKSGLYSSPSSSPSGMNMTPAQMSHMSNESYQPSKSDPGFWFIILLAVVQIFIGIGALFSGIWRNLAIGFGILLSLILWVVGQSLGAYFTGLATDPNSALLFILLALAILGCTNLDEKLLIVWNKFQKVIVGTPTNSHKPKVI